MTVLSVFSIAGPSLVVGFRVLPEQAHIRSSPVCDGPPFRIRGQGSGGEASLRSGVFKAPCNPSDRPPDHGRRPQAPAFFGAPAARPGGFENLQRVAPAGLHVIGSLFIAGVALGAKARPGEGALRRGRRRSRLHDHALRDDACATYFHKATSSLRASATIMVLRRGLAFATRAANHSDSADCG